ncbi:MAG: bifunctional adenosylcobinamide kinase/adenosylcobinamide-phosphate guanylyltransferase [Clostridia bacterium]|nr:bifunctional adenosylcobinamide kinase/adenosylcobinamide-phosphate guanylyltransferase [Clostridia bacterium]
MIFVTGPLFAGKRECIRNALHLTEAEFAEKAVWDVQELAEGDLNALADRLSRHEIVIATEIGGGVVPIDARERAHREAAGRLACLLAARADVVLRVCCGLPQVLKGELPC